MPAAKAAQRRHPLSPDVGCRAREHGWLYLWSILCVSVCLYEVAQVNMCEVSSEVSSFESELGHGCPG